MPIKTFYSSLVVQFQRWFYIEVLVYWVVVIVSSSYHVLNKDTGSPDILERISVKDKGQTLLLEFNEINWLQAYDSYVKVHTANKTFLLRGKISDLGKRLPSNQFQRIHRSIIVNLSKIKAIEPYSNGEQFITLETNEKLKLSRSYKGKLSQLTLN